MSLTAAAKKLLAKVTASNVELDEIKSSVAFHIADLIRETKNVLFVVNRDEGAVAKLLVLTFISRFCVVVEENEDKVDDDYLEESVHCAHATFGLDNRVLVSVFLPLDASGNPTKEKRKYRLMIYFTIRGGDLAVENKDLD